MTQQGTTNQQTQLHISLKHRKLLSCSSSTSRRELHDTSIATRCLGIKIPLLVKLEKQDSEHHGFLIGPLAHQIWAVIKRHVELHRPQNVHELEDAIQAEWHLLTPCALLPYIEEWGAFVSSHTSEGNAIKMKGEHKLLMRTCEFQKSSKPTSIHNSSLLSINCT